MNYRAMIVLAKKDIRVALQKKSVSMPMLLVPLLMLVVMPAAMVLGIQHAPADDIADGLGMLQGNLPPALAWLEALPPLEQAVVMITHFLFAPLYLIVPVMVAMAPGVTVLALGVIVLVSMRVRSFIEAFQISGVVVLPLAALLTVRVARRLLHGDLLARL